MLVRGLPAVSRMQTRMRDTLEFPATEGENRFGPWATENYQLAALIDSVNELQRVLIAVNSDSPPKSLPPAPRPVVRVQKKDPRSTLTDAQITYLEDIRARHRGEAR